jgi:hypothetical protein
MKRKKNAVNKSAEGRIGYDFGTRISLYATDAEGKRAIAWARRRWRTWNCGRHEQPRSASTLLRDVLIHAMEADRKRR